MTTPPRPIGRPRLSERGTARNLTVRLRPEDEERLEQIQAALGDASATAAIRYALERAPKPRRRRRA